MDRATNPYAPGAGAPPPALVGREEILEDAMVALKRVKNGLFEKSLMLVGLRGVGKTVLLSKIETLAEEYGYLAVFIEAHESRQKKSLSEMLIPDLRRVLFKLDRGEAISEKVKKALRVLKSFIGSMNVKVEGIELSIDPEAGEGDSGNLEIDLTSLFVALGEAAVDRNTAIAIIIDELQYLEEKELSAIIMAIHRVSQKSLPLILVGAGLPQLVGKAGNAKSYAERLFAYPVVGALKKKDAINAIRQPIEKLGLSITSDGLNEIFDITKGYPYFLQEWGYQSWNIAKKSPINVDDVKQASKIAIANLDTNFFRVRFDRLTPSEKKYVHALAELGAEPQRSGEIANKIKKTVEQAAPLRSQLIHKGMIYSPAHGETAFTVPLFEEFLIREKSRQIPLF